jgi:hypothetical protein
LQCNFINFLYCKFAIFIGYSTTFLQQFQSAFSNESNWTKTKTFIEEIHNYYGDHQQIEVKLDAIEEKALQAHCKECWQFLFTGIVYGFIKHCHTQSSRLDDMFNTDEKAGKMTTTMEMLKILQEVNFCNNINGGWPLPLVRKNMYSYD